MDSRSFVFNPHYLAVWRTGELPALCTQWGYQQMPLLATDQAYIFVSAEQGLALYDVSSCGTDETPTKVYENVFGVPSPDLQYAAYTNRPSPDPDDDRFIAIQNIVSGEVKIVGIGEYPVWSRDSHWLAYIGLDGIYVANVAEGTRPRRVVLYPNLFNNGAPTYAGRSYWDIPPEVSWSPDGKWLIYHKWTGTNYYTGINPSDNAIYKLNIETGEETKIIDGGMYPYWRWPVQQ